MSGRATDSNALRSALIPYSTSISPPIGVFNVQDLAVMVLLIILVPLFYLILPLWLTAALLLLVATSILYFTWEPLLRARWAIWLATVTLLVVDSGAAFLGDKAECLLCGQQYRPAGDGDGDYELVGTERNEGTRHGPVGCPIGAL